MEDKKKRSCKYFPVIQNPGKAVFSRKFVYINRREWTDPTGIFIPAICKSIAPGPSAIYVVELRAEYAKEKLAILERAVEGRHPIIGPFDTLEEAIVAERKIRPLSDKEKIAQADSNLAELDLLRKRNAELEKSSRQNNR